ncbi:hypothetical protein LCGC14_2590690, partial [marine sediment metagenome]
MKTRVVWWIIAGLFGVFCFVAVGVRGDELEEAYN